MSISAIEVRELPETQTAVVRHRITIHETGRIPGWIGQTRDAVQRAGQQPGREPFVRYLSMETDAIEIEVGWPVPEPFAGDGEVQSSALPGGSTVVASCVGPYEELALAYEATKTWCREQSHEITGPPWESYFTDPREEPDAAKWRTDIHFPVRA